MKIKNFPELFEIDLPYAYDCEQRLVKKGIPSMIDAASSVELRQALEQHLQQTRNHVTGHHGRQRVDIENHRRIPTGGDLGQSSTTRRKGEL